MTPFSLPELRFGKNMHLLCMMASGMLDIAGIGRRDHPRFPFDNIINRRNFFAAGLAAAIAVFTSACGTGNGENTSMKEKKNTTTGVFESDPHRHKNNSVTGAVTAGGKAVPGASVTVVSTGERVAVEPGGFYIVVLDPAKLGKGAKELLFTAPGYQEQKQSVWVPENQQVHLDVDLQPAK